MLIPQDSEFTTEESKINQILDNLMNDSYFLEYSTCKYSSSFLFAQQEKPFQATDLIEISTTNKWWIEDNESKSKSIKDLLDSDDYERAYSLFRVAYLPGLQVKSAKVTADLLEIVLSNSSIFKFIGDRETGYNDFGWNIAFKQNNNQSCLQISSGIGDSAVIVHPLFKGLLSD